MFRWSSLSWEISLTSLKRLQEWFDQSACQTEVRQCGGQQQARFILVATDLIPEEAAAFVAQMRKAELDTIFLVAPTSTDDRIKLIAENSSGFIYIVARTGMIVCAKTSLQKFAR
jgi:Tryptophan synthase alpha chain